MSNTPYVIGAGSVQNDGTARAIVQVEELAEKQSQLCGIFKYHKTSESWGSFNIEWVPNILSIVYSESGFELISVSPDGHFRISSTTGSVEGEILGRTRQSALRCGRAVGRSLFVSGMDRQVLRRPFNGEWGAFDSNVVTPTGDLRVVGFNAIDGVDENDLYACGFMGEIWRCRTSVWKQLASPTNAILHALRVVKPNLAFAAGQRGVLLRGNGDAWDQIDHQETEDDIWGLEWFQGKLYIATAKKLYTLADDGTLDPVKTGLGKKATHRELHTNGSVLWSFGSKTVAYTEDGTTWHDVTP